MPTQNYRSAPSWVQTLLNNRNPFGSSGFNLSNSMANYISGGSNGQIDPRLAPYGSWQTVGSEATHPEFVSTNSRVGPNGVIDGNLTQIPNDAGDFDWDRIIDQAGVHYDPEFGLVTNSSNIRDPHAANQANAFWVMASMVGLPALAHALGAGAASGTGGGFDFSAHPYTGQFGGGTGVGDLGAGFSFGGNEFIAPGVEPGFEPPSGGFTPGGGTAGSVAPGLGNLPSWLTTGNARSAFSLYNLANRLLGGGGSGGRSGGGMPNGNNNSLLGILGQLLGGGLSYGLGQHTNDQYRGDIQDMLRWGSPVGPDQRKPFQDIITNFYNGTPEQRRNFIDQIPGLSAQRDYLDESIHRRFAANGQAEPAGNNPAYDREFTNMADRLVGQRFDQEMNRMGRWGGYDFDPSRMAGLGLGALGDIFNSNRGMDQGLAMLLGSLLGGGNGQGGQGGGDLWSLLGRLFGGGEDGGEDGDIPEGGDEDLIGYDGGGFDPGDDVTWI